ncbi:hypothetical protein CYMTET_34000 [Cymbomonas tetramitiformis]|uniref:Uncharacterized protein n=1 Tax=Cymbomonas tetramitiformis TaxID=36881 RepID=A0AAE0KQE0_9CHLO|nr:hypothetical protein CYMTET_34000 [Cymbomonas tetramitiformis]
MSGLGAGNSPLPLGAALPCFLWWCAVGAGTKQSEGRPQVEGLHALWEFCTNPGNHKAVSVDTMLALVGVFKTKHAHELHTLGALALWGLNSSQQQRAQSAQKLFPEMLMGRLRDTVKAKLLEASSAPPPAKTEEGQAEEDGEAGDAPPTPEGILQSVRNKLQYSIMGALCMLSVDRTARRGIHTVDPKMRTLLDLCSYQPKGCLCSSASGHCA